ncbi:MAG TPA: ATP-binding protein [Methanospirillum sp.]|nr:ATP-binding protein [Methanospirillum sp.]
MPINPLNQPFGIELAVGPGEVLTVLLVDPDPDLGRFSQANLQLSGLIKVYPVTTGQEALELTKERGFDAIVSDYDMPDMNGIDLHRALQQSGVKIPFILFTVPGDGRAILEAIREHADFYMNRDAAPDKVYVDLSQKIRQSVELFRTRNRLELYSKHLEELVEQRTRELREIQRFAVIGELATMIGHDMRNPLQVITNLNYLLGRKVSSMPAEESAILKKHGIQDLFSRIGTEAQYLNKIVSDLQDYAREVNPKLVRVDPGQFLDELLTSIPLPDTVQVVKQFERGIEVPIDPTLLRRVMENLIINAIQAMEQGGTLTLATGKSHGLIFMTVSDTGTGIAPAVQSRIFEPLFTTKSKGTGFGLPVSKRLVEAHGGTIAMKSSSPAGTTFEVILPESVNASPVLRDIL